MRYRLLLGILARAFAGDGREIVTPTSADDELKGGAQILRISAQSVRTIIDSLHRPT